MESALPNPDVYLNHIPPDQLAVFEATRNLCLAILGAVIWDILVYVADDIKILRRGPIHVATVCFVFSRVFSLLFILLSVIEQTRTIANCSAMVIVIGLMIVFGNSCTMFLFLQRLRAVYADTKWVQAVYCFLYIAAVGVMTVVVYGAHAVHIPGTGYCIYSKVEQYMGASAFMASFFDTSVFIGISYKIASSHSDLDVGVSWDTLVSGRALPRLSRAVLQGGQQYYLVAVCISFPVGVLVVIPQTPPIPKLTLSFVLVPLMASMACRVFRNIKLTNFEGHSRAELSDMNFSPRHGYDPKSKPNHSSAQHLGNSGGYGGSTAYTSSSGPYTATLNSDIPLSHKGINAVEVALPHRTYTSSSSSDQRPDTKGSMGDV